MKKIEEYLKTIESVIDNGFYKNEWESLKNNKLPQWYRDAKFGIFIHWGPYSVPAFDTEWYSRHMYEKDHHVFKHHLQTYGEHKTFGYKDFIPMFKAENFDPENWADLFKKSGAKFVMPVAEHHDGFQMYDSELSEWCSSKMGPKKDIVGLLKTEIEKRGMTLTTSSHRVEHYWFMGGGREFESDITGDIPYGHLYWPSVKKPFTDQDSIFIENIDKDFMDDWLVRTCEIVDKYQPKVMFFDWWIQVIPMKPYLKKFAAYYYNRALEWGQEVAINYKHDAFMYGTAVRDIERGQLSNISPDFWQNDTSVAKNSWCYTENNDYKKPEEIISDLIDVVSKNGSLLLNIGPKADGSIPKEDIFILEKIGEWLDINGEGIYDTIYWKRYGEGPTTTVEGDFTDTLRSPFTAEDFRFTFKGNNLYVFAMKWPDTGIVNIKTLGKKSKLFNAIINNVEILGSANTTFKLCDECLTVINDKLISNAPVCIKICID